jgi:hypothetical protein
MPRSTTSLYHGLFTAHNKQTIIYKIVAHNKQYKPKIVRLWYQLIQAEAKLNNDDTKITRKKYNRFNKW